MAAHWQSRKDQSPKDCQDRVQSSGLPFLLQSLLCNVFPILRKKQTARILSKIITELTKPRTVAVSM